MSTRRLSLICALLLTAALLYMLPWLWRAMTPADTNRMDERLRPVRTRTLTVWLIKGGMEDGGLISSACSAFERANEGARVFLRTVGEDEWTGPDAVLPDVMLFTTGSVIAPEKVFIPLSGAEGLVEGAASIGMSGGTQYAVPLWFAPNLLSLPEEWFETPSTPAPTSLLGGEEDVGGGRSDVIEGEALPWRALLSPDALTLPDGVALEQLMNLCPNQLRSELAALCAPAASTPSPAPTAAALKARVVTLRQHLSAAESGERRVVCLLEPVVSERVRLIAVCREGDDASAFLRFLLEAEQQSAALDYGLLPLTGAGEAAEPVTRALLESVREGAVLPNAFAHTLEELRALCLDAFVRAADPVQTLLKLR